MSTETGEVQPKMQTKENFMVQFLLKARRSKLWPGCLIFLIAISSGTNALAQCSFNWELAFDPVSFPDLPVFMASAMTEIITRTKARH
ncbi:MAG: hypothetical protein IPH37_18670 [Burkholderiales bacterium]|nr:hypothetical protein [Burkholderiales bacterium]